MEKPDFRAAFRLAPAFVAFLLPLCAACSRSDAEASADALEREEQTVRRMDRARAAMAPVGACAAAMADNARYALVEAAEGGPGASVERFGQKFIRTGSVSLEVRDLAAAQRDLGEWAKRFGGYMEETSSETTSGSVTARIPSGSFEMAMEEVGKVGTVKSQSVNVEDATERFYDLETRLGTKRVMRERLTNYLAQAKSVKEMVQVERELNDVVSELESMEGRMKRLSAQIDRSTIRVDYRLPYRADPRGGSFKWPDVGESARRFAVNVFDFAMLAVEFMLYAVVCGVPVLAVLALAFWLLFGKVGLLKRLFRRLR